MSTIKDIIDRINNGEVNIDKGIDEMGDFFVEEIRKEYEKSGSPSDYWKIAIKVLTRMLEKMKNIEETEE